MMNVIEWIAIVLTSGLFVYLTAALVMPEWFE